LKPAAWLAIGGASAAALRPWEREAILAALEAFRPDVVHFRLFDGPTVISEVAKRYAVVRTVHTPWTYCPMGTKYGPNKREICDRRLGVACLKRDRELGCNRRDDGVVVGKVALARRLAACWAFGAVDKKVGALVVTSQWMKGMLTASGQKSEHVWVVPPPLDLPPAFEGINGHLPEVVSVGRMVPGKGFDDLIRAMTLLPEARLTLTGDGPSRPALEALARELGVASRVTFTGWVPYDRLGEIYGRSRVVAVPSLYPEAFGNTGTEALGYGRPVVAYDVGGIPEWLSDGEVGWLARAGDHVDLAAKLQRFIEDPLEAAVMGAVGRRRVADFALPRHLERQLAVYAYAKERFGQSVRRGHRRVI
jgi:glycosyltransferase involved in cell wall biosynthesis